MKRFYDEEHHRLIYVGQAATEQFWDEHWKIDDFRRSVTANPNSWVAKITKRYLPMGSRILEGGCGPAKHVYALQKRGYLTIGVDFAPKTVSLLNNAVPELDVRLGDVRDLPFEDNSFDGYWSLGVIEHFWDGYDTIAREMQRVLRKGGYLFLTFPAMTKIRNWKALRGAYAPWEALDQEPEGFYQFALCPDRTESFFSKFGFITEYHQGLDGIKGFKDEIPILRPQLQKLYDSPNFLARVSRNICNTAIMSKWCGHICLLVLRKQ
jgi:SAM-dependent methyltransferase